MSEQDNGQVSTLQRPTNDDKEAWKTYWRAQGWPWRTEPEIDADRQKYLDERRTIVPNIEMGIYPFRGIKLRRADVEWLLATHENGRGQVDWSDENQRSRQGLDLRGADLSQENLHHLPLARLVAGLDEPDWIVANKGQRTMGAVSMKGADLQGVHLEGANLRKAHLEETYLVEAHLEKASLISAHLEDANLEKAFFDGADLRGVFFDEGTYIRASSLGSEELGFVFLSNIRWGNANLAVVKWLQVKMLGDEHQARQKKDHEGKLKDRDTRLYEYQDALRANRQLAIELQAQGLSEAASRFAYRAQKLRRIVLRRQKKFGQYIFSGFLDLLAGYGYRPGRSVIWYLITIFGFALAYFAVGHLPFFPDAFVFSLTSFHGRGFFPGLGSQNSLHNPLVIMAAFEAVVGLLIEISFIATFTQRFFGR